MQTISLLNSDYKEVSDTVIRSTIAFKSLDSTNRINSYAWHIGTDPRVFTQKSFSLRIGIDDVKDTALWHTSIPVTLRVNASSEPCFPNDSTSMTLTRRMYFIRNSEVPWKGRFQGAFSDKPNETFQLNIRHVENHSWGGVYDPDYLDVVIDNVLNTGDTVNFGISAPTYKGFRAEEVYTYNINPATVYGVGFNVFQIKYNTSTEEISIEYDLQYTYRNNSNEFKHFYFRGRKVH
jgi:hypothetical protein